MRIKQELNIRKRAIKSGNISRLRVLEMRQKLASIEQKIEEVRGKKSVLIRQADSNKKLYKASGSEKLKWVMTVLKPYLIYLHWMPEFARQAADEHHVSVAATRFGAKARQVHKTEALFSRVGLLLKLSLLVESWLLKPVCRQEILVLWV